MFLFSNFLSYRQRDGNTGDPHTIENTKCQNGKSRIPTIDVNNINDGPSTQCVELYRRYVTSFVIKLATSEVPMVRTLTTRCAPFSSCSKHSFWLWVSFS